MNRTAIAFGLTFAAIALPAGAWYVRGSADVERTIERIEKEPRELARLTAQRLARRIGWDLEALRSAESERPYYHYQALMHDPRGVSEGIALSPSPLAGNTNDPLVEVWFQVEHDGVMTSPFFGEPLAGTPLVVGHARPVSSPAPGPFDESPERVHATRTLEALRPSAPTLVLMSETEETRQAAVQLLEGSKTSGEAARAEGPSGPARESVTKARAVQVQQLQDSAFFQNANTLQLAEDLKDPGSRSARARLATGRRTGGKIVSVVVGRLEWGRVDAAGTVTQGFQVALDRIAAAYSGGTLPARILPGRSVGATNARLPLEGVDWHVSVDPSPLEPLIGERGDALRRRFVNGFVRTTALALLVGMLVVLLVRRAEQTAAERSRFAASAAHELRTPLASLRLHAEMLAEGLGDPARGPEYARSIADETERLGRVVSNVLGFTRLERGALTVRPAPGDLGLAVRGIVSRLTPGLESKGSKVETTIASPLPAVAFDHDALEQILRNLLDNAEKFGARATDRTVHVRVSAENGSVVLDVRDHGPGVLGPERRRLFRPFVRSDDRDAPPGLGLGLAMVQALAAAHGGRAEYVAPPEGGAEFRVRFPAVST